MAKKSPFFSSTKEDKDYMKKGVKKIMDDSLLPLGTLGAMAIGGLVAAFQKNKQKLKSTKKETKQKQSMTSNKAYSNKFFGHTDNKNK
jgi:hypothetical protein